LVRGKVRIVNARTPALAVWGSPEVRRLVRTLVRSADARDGTSIREDLIEGAMAATLKKNQSFWRCTRAA
jgi:hypothetical protein